MTQAPAPPFNPNPAPAQPQAGNMTLVLIALALGLVTVILTFLHINNIRKQTRVETVTVYRLNRSVKPGDKIRPDSDLEAIALPKIYVDALKGKIIRKEDLAIFRNDPVRSFASRGEFLMVSVYKGREEKQREVSPGMRAYALPVNSRTAPVNLNVDDYVDVLAFMTLPGLPPQTFVVMERVHVLQVGSRSTTDQDARLSAYNSILIEVTRDQARDLSTIRQWMGRGRGEFEIVIRNPGDTRTDPALKGGINPIILKAIEGKTPQ